MSAPNPPVLEIHSGIVLKGNLSMVKDVILTGKFEGELETLGCLTVAPGGVAKGTIDAGALVLEPGNLVEARIKVGPKAKPTAKKPEKVATPPGEGWAGRLKKLTSFAFGRK
jgi:hypothetical protein